MGSGPRPTPVPPVRGKVSREFASQFDVIGQFDAKRFEKLGVKPLDPLENEIQNSKRLEGRIEKYLKETRAVFDRLDNQSTG